VLSRRDEASETRADEPSAVLSRRDEASETRADEPSVVVAVSVEASERRRVERCETSIPAASDEASEVPAGKCELEEGSEEAMALERGCLECALIGKS